MKFSGEILAGGGGGHAVLVPAEVAGQLSRKNARVLALVNGIEYRSRIARYGGRSYLGLRLDLLRSIGLDTGDSVDIDLSEEPEPPPEAEPEPAQGPELSAALAGVEGARLAFDALPADHRREYLRWVAGGTSPQTRADRAAKLVRRLSSPPR